MSRPARLAATAVVLLAAGGFGGYRLHSDHASTPTAAPSPTASPSPTTTPSPTASPTPTATPDCFDTARTQADLNACAARDRDAAEATLNAVLAAARAATSGTERTTLDRSQREWEAYRTTFCGFHTAGGGSVGPMNAASCRAALAHDRARDVCDWLAPNVAEERPPVCRTVPA